uniref:Branched-chain-amino-acid aminotransferase n=2 Tax=Ditylenchus dipsaci TaxID=166011 RepID=A0A915CMJ6_9BILA
MKNFGQMKAVLVTAVRGVSSTLNNSSAAVMNAIPSIHPPQTSPHTSFYFKDLETEIASGAQLQPKPLTSDNLKFGHTYADHMMETDWSADDGWTNPKISPLHNLSVHPGAKVLHYAIELFEGMKAYRGVDNRIRLFRADMNMARMKKSALRSSLPDFDAEELIQIVCENDQNRQRMGALLQHKLPLPETYYHWNRSNTGSGAYYPTGFQPITLLADSSYVRAFPGGVGSFKMGCNYAPTIMVSKLAADLGCQQVLWLFRENNEEKLTEAGTMNIFVYWINEDGEKELCTPPLTDGLILPGVTRDSLLSIAREWGEFKVVERYPTMEEIRKSIAERRLLQLFGAGTACVVSPVGNILHRNPETNQYENLAIPTMASKSNIMQRFYDTIMDIQYGRIADYPEWCRIID